MSDWEGPLVHGGAKMNVNEFRFLETVKAYGVSRIYRSGWPDFLIQSPKGMQGVEVKVPPSRVSDRQARMFAALEEAGLTTLVWTPLKPDEAFHWREWNSTVVDSLRPPNARPRREHHGGVAGVFTYRRKRGISVLIGYTLGKNRKRRREVVEFVRFGSDFDKRLKDAQKRAQFALFRRAAPRLGQQVLFG